MKKNIIVLPLLENEVHVPRLLKKTIDNLLITWLFKGFN